MELRILSQNAHKVGEFQRMFGSANRLIADATRVAEIQTEDMDRMVADKVIKAFAKIRRPVFVDHTGLYFELLNGLPGGLTEIFFNRLETKGIAELIGNSSNPKVRAVTLLGYCDGRAVHIFKGEICGTVPKSPRGPEGFQWDPVFQPDGYEQTFAEMGEDKKNEISMRRLAVNAFLKHLSGG